MKVGIVGEGLISLTLAKILVNKGIYVDIFSGSKINNTNKSRTIGISKTNVEFFNKNITNINKFLWKINKIEIFTNNLKNEKVLNFENNNNQLFSVIKNHQLYGYLIKELKTNKFFKLKKNFTNQLLGKKEYGLIVNCDHRSFLTKKFFYKRIYKDYKSYAHTAIVSHKKFNDNNIASQIFTEKGPLAFLPISDNETSVVYSARGPANIDFENFIKVNNFRYSILKIKDISFFKLSSNNLRKYYHSNILAFGDLLHRLHPLAGQGFNMSIRDIEELINLIMFKMDHGLELDSSICADFEKKTKHKNYLFSNSIDFVYELFNLESKIKSPVLSKSIQLLGKYKSANKLFTKFADKGIVI